MDSDMGSLSEIDLQSVEYLQTTLERRSGPIFGKPPFSVKIIILIIYHVDEMLITGLLCHCNELVEIHYASPRHGPPTALGYATSPSSLVIQHLRTQPRRRNLVASPH